jgi:hypothetical protein
MKLGGDREEKDMREISMRPELIHKAKRNGFAIMRDAFL